MTVTLSQIMLAAFVGVAAVMACYLPFGGVVVKHYYGGHDKGDNGVDLLTVVLTAVGWQFVVIVLFNMVLWMLDATLKGDMKIFGKGGAFDLFWNMQVSSATGPVEMLTTLIYMLRHFIITANAFLPVMTVLGGAAYGYSMAARQLHSRGTEDGMKDYLNFGIKMFISTFIASVLYVAWGKMASVGLYLDGGLENGQRTVFTATSDYWMHALGVGGKDASQIIIK